MRLKKIIKRSSLILGIVLVYDFFYLMMYNILHFDHFYPGETWLNNIPLFIGNLIPIFILTICNSFIVFKLWNRTVLVRSLPVKIVADVIVSFFVLYIVNISFIFFAGLLHTNNGIAWAGTILCNTMLLMGVEIVYYIKRSREALQRAEYAKREALQYHYDSLKAQVNPHFLFNSLSILYSLITIDTAKASGFTLALSDIYRYILTIKDKPSVPLREELGFLHSYISILEMRFNNQLSVKITGEDMCSNKRIVPYTLQLLIENVTKHNIISEKSPMNVSITIDENNITVCNPINIKEVETTGGIGHKYLAEQYKLQGKTFKVVDNGKTFTAIIPYL